MFENSVIFVEFCDPRAKFKNSWDFYIKLLNTIKTYNNKKLRKALKIKRNNAFDSGSSQHTKTHQYLSKPNISSASSFESSRYLILFNYRFIRICAFYF